MNKSAVAQSEFVPTETAKSSFRASPRQISVGVVALVIVVAGSLYGINRVRFNIAHEETDDAQVEGDISPVLPRVSGYVSKVLVVDNQRVVAGQPLMEIDARELDLKISESSA